jgi:non-ribosomal peptide synthetase component F
VTDVDVDQRIAALSPERRALFEQLYARRRGPVVHELSVIQRGLYFIERLLPASSLYTIAWRCRIRGELDGAAFIRSFAAVVDRHEALRTRFGTRDGRPVQIVDPRVEFEVPYDDLRPLAAPEREAALARITDDGLRAGFDLSRGPLVRVRLVRLADDLHVALMYLHHIVFDAGSTGILLDELCRLYDAEVNGRPAGLAPPSLQYGDFVAWQQSRLQGTHLRTLVDFWRRTLDGAPGLLDLPTARPRPPVQSYAGRPLRLVIPAEPTARMAGLAAGERSTLFMAYLAVFQLLLARYTGRTDICVGTPAANRRRPEFASLVGFCVNMIVMRTDLSGDPTFRELLGRVRRVCLDAYEHEELPFDQVVDAVAPQRSLSHNPLFQAACVLDPSPGTGARLGPAVIEAVEGLHPGMAKFDLSFAGVRQGDDVVVTIDYSSDLFDEPFVAELAGNFRLLWDAAVAEPDRPVSRLPMQDPQEVTRLTALASPAPVTPIDELVARHAAGTPGAPAVLGGGAELTYADLDVAVGRMTERLGGAGVDRESVVGLCLEPSPELIVALLAVARTGAAALPVSPGVPVTELADAIRAAKAVAVVCPDGLVGALTAQEGLDGVAVLPPAAPDGPAAGPPPAAPPAAPPASPGPTPAPEPGRYAALSRLNLSATAAAVAAGFRLTSADRVAVRGSAGSPRLVAQALGALYAGATCLLGAADGPGGPTVLWTPYAAPPPDPAILRGLRLWITDAPGRPSPGWTLPVDRAVAYFADRGGLAAVAAIPAGDPDDRAVTPLPGVSILLLDDALRPVPVGVPGDVYLAGPQITVDAEGRAGPAEPFVANPYGDGWLYRTGDVMRRRADGRLVYVARRSELFDMDGGVVTPPVVAEAVLAHPAVRQAVATVDTDEGGAKRLTVYVVGDADRADARDLQAFLAERLPQYMLPAAVVAVDDIPLRADGTVDSGALGEARDEPVLPERPYLAPRTALERILVAVWCDLLSVERVGVNDNFFALGGHSLMAVQLLSSLAEVLGVELPISVLFGASTPATLAAQLSTALGGVEAAERLAESVEAILELSEEEVERRLADQAGR